MRQWLKNSGLTLVLMGMFLACLVGHALCGWKDYNQEQEAHASSQVMFRDYLLSGHFLESVAENWESEFLQMAVFVLLTVFLYQKGSPESKDPNEDDPVDEDPQRHRSDPKAPWPVRKGGIMLTLYSHSLGLALMSLFLIAFILHLFAGLKEYNEQQREHGEAAVGVMDYLYTVRFWFESFQNWQSEFLSVAAMVYLSVYLREKGSAQSKPVAAGHSETE
jgi:hypothetical protein